MTLLLLSSCSVYHNKILFRTEASIIPGNVVSALADANDHYTIQANDFIELKVYTNGGELIIDPNNEIAKEINVGGSTQQVRENPRFLVRKEGFVKLPLVGDIKVAGLTLHQVDSLLEMEYSSYYEDAYVITRYVNKRVVVLGATGGKVIPLQNEDTNLLEVLAMAGGIGMQARADNIRLIRGDLNNPEVHIINISTIEGMKQSSLKVLPNDIIYVEPMQHVKAEVIRDLSPLLGIVSSLLTLALLVFRL